MLKKIENGNIDWDFLINTLELKDSREIRKKIFWKMEITQWFWYFLRYLRTLKNLKDFKDREKTTLNKENIEERINNIKKRIKNVEKYMFNKISQEEYKKNDRFLIEKARENMWN